jgi:hypothetical protein
MDEQSASIDGRPDRRRCWLLFSVFVLPLLSAPDAFAQDTVVIARIAVRDAATFRFAEVFHQSGRWVFPDVGYVDYGSSDYREFFAGFGRTLVESSKATVVGELYYLQAAGQASGSAKYVQPWVLVALRPAKRISSEMVYFPYVPLTSSARLQHVLERAKVEYAINNYLKMGAGYGAYQMRGSEWQHKPFVTATVSPPRVGDIEFWVQRVPGNGVQLQVRYLRVLK